MPPVQLRVEDEGAPAFAPKVVEILNSALAPDSTTSPSQAAAALDALCSQDHEEHGTAGSFLWWFWDLVHDLARQLPHDSPQQDRLVAVIKALSSVSSKPVKLGEDWGSGSDNLVQPWTGLPMFANTFREKLDEVDTGASSEEQKKERRVNLNAYAARVAGTGLVPLDMHAIWALVDALEGTMKPVRGAPDEVNEDPAAVEDVTYKVKSAAAWAIHAGHVLHGRDETVDGATAGPLWRLDKKDAIKLRRKFKGTDGLCPQRWQLWKQRFELIRDTDGLDEAVRREAADACNAMAKVEKDRSS